MSLDFMTRAWIAGVGIALIAGPLGSIMVWRRMSHFGDTLAHATLLGLCFSLFFEIHLYLGLISVSMILAFCLALFLNKARVGSDAILSILAYSTLSIGLILATTLKGVRIHLLSYLYGDILSVHHHDLYWIYAVVVLGLLLLGLIWRSVLSIIVHEDLARVEGVRVSWINTLLILLMAVVFAIAMKLLGILVMGGLLIIPAAAARYYAKSPEQMALLASVFGIVAVSLGIFSSYQQDWPTGPAIVLSATLIFCASFVWDRARH